MTALFGVEPATYRPHAVHLPEFGYPETNCWVDVVIEMLHARGDEPLAALGCTLALDHELDQFTFFKPRPQDLEALFGIDVRELTVFRPLLEHIGLQLEHGRAVIVEVDSFWLPDTAGAGYRSAHQKSSVIVDSFTEDRLVYFHNGGVHDLSGEDLDSLRHPVGLPGYAEVVRFDTGPRLAGPELVARTRELLREHLARTPKRSPFAGFGDQLGRELDGLRDLEPDGVHAFAFATTRMAGAAAALAGAHVRWLLGVDGEEAALALDQVSQTTRILTMRLMRRKPFDPTELLGALTSSWAQAHERLDALV